MQRVWMTLQFTVSVVAGSTAFWWDTQLTRIGEGSVLWGVIVGLIAARAMTFLIVWAQFGWRAARSISLSG